MIKRWSLPPPLPPEIQHELDKFPPIGREILFKRGIRTSAEAETFFMGTDKEGFDPFLMSGMDQAVERLLKAIKSRERIVVYGDYDADGVTATALLLEVLRGVGADVGHYIPNRFRDGYGLNQRALTEIRESGAQLVLTVDCGVRAVDEVVHAASIGLGVIVTDHHQPGPQLPPALAVVNPMQSGDAYPFKKLAGVGVAYKLAQALLHRLEEHEPVDSLDLVAIGTVADLVPLTGENRDLVRKGLEQLNKTRRPGLHALVEVVGYEFGRLNTTSIGFGLGPRLNAAGRLDSAETALRLLITTEEREAKRLGNQLEKINRDRRQILSKMVEKARILGISEDPPPLIIFAVDPDFNEGVVGLTASRLVDEFYRPAIVGCRGEHVTRASARSIREFHITEALEDCAGLLERYGGHSAAAGFSIRNENLDQFIRQLRQVAAEKLSGIELRPTLEIDAIVRISDLDWSLLDFIDYLEPCGFDNPFPVLALEDVNVMDKRQVGSEGSHLKLTLGSRQKYFDAIAFRQGHLYETLPQRVDLAFHLERNDFRGVTSLQLNVLDLRPAGSLGDPGLTVWGLQSSNR